MKEKAVKDNSLYKAEMKELERIIEHKNKLEKFMTTKCTERSWQNDEIAPRQCKTAKIVPLTLQ